MQERFTQQYIDNAQPGQSSVEDAIDSKQPGPGHLTRGLNVGIIGGAIAGCASAGLLHRAGCNVTVFERSKGNLEDRGVGLSMKIPTLNALKQRDMIDQDMPFVPVWRRIFARPHKGAPADDSPWDTYWDEPVAIHANHWGVLYRNLRQRVPDHIYRQGCEVTGITEHADGTVEVQLADGTTHSFDLVICADGYESVGRRVLYPDAEIQLTTYFTWRGMIDEWNVPRPDVFEEKLIFFGYESGHAFIYFVPSPEHGGTVGKRRLNWAFQETITGKDVPGVPPDENGYVQRGLAPGAATPEQIEYCRAIARQHFPAYFADIVDRTPQPFTQPIRDMGVPNYVRGHICLMGDAAILARPHIGAGASKALDDALALADALASPNTLAAALAAWEVERSAVGRELLDLGRSLGKHIVEAPPAWDAMDPAAMVKWWQEVIGERYWFWLGDVAEYHPTGGR